MAQLGQAKPRLLCSLVHKFGRKGVDDFDAFIQELKSQPSPAVGELFVFVDECHRTQTGKLHKTMKALLPGAVFIGFTGTPLLKADKQTSLEVFGGYIHTYKFGEGVEDRLKKGRERLDQALEAIALLCDAVQPPRGELEHIHYFCGNTEIPDDLKAHEPQRVALYKGSAALVRGYANIADDMPTAGYTEAQIAQIKQHLDRYLKLREIIRQASGETIDLKAYEADMRHLIDTYIEAGGPRKISDFGEIGLLELIVKSGMADAISSLPNGIKNNKKAVAEVIANNVRSKIIKEHLNDPAFCDKMSVLLKEILDDLRAQRIDYEAFLKRMADVAKQVQAGAADDTPEPLKKSPGLRAIFNQLERDLTLAPAHALGEPPPAAYSGVIPGSSLDLALRIDATIRSRKPDGWRGVLAKERVVKSLIHEILKDAERVERLFLIIKAQSEY